MIASRLTRFRHDGLAFDVVDEGPIDGDVVVLLHGFPERPSSWRKVAPLLHAAGLRTLALDQRGYSPGARPRRRRDYAIPLLVGDVVALIDLADGPVHLVGHDWGANVAWHLAAEHPELVRTLTTFSVPHPTAFTRAVRGSSQLFHSYYIVLFQLPGLPELAARRPGWVMDRALLGSGMTPAEVERFREEIVESGALRGGLSWYRAIPFASQGAGRVSVPTTFVWSDGDTPVRRRGAELCGDYVTGPYEYVELAGVTHWIPTQAPAAAAEAILERISSADPSSADPSSVERSRSDRRDHDADS